MAPPIVLALSLLPSLLETVLWPSGVQVTPSPRFRCACALVLVAVVFYDWRAFGPPPSLVPTVSVAERGDSGSRPSIYPDPALAGDEATVFTNDEVACAFNLGRVDYWYTESQWDLKKYLLNTRFGPRGKYAGATVLSSAAGFKQQIATCSRQHGCMLAVFRTGRFPFEEFERLSREAVKTFGGTEIRQSAALALLKIPRSTPIR
jgi:hypothetical protein